MSCATKLNQPSMYIVRSRHLLLVHRLFNKHNYEGDCKWCIKFNLSTTAHHSKNSLKLARNYEFNSTNFTCGTKIKQLNRQSTGDPQWHHCPIKALLQSFRLIKCLPLAPLNKDLPHSCSWASKVEALNKGLEWLPYFCFVHISIGDNGFVQFM